MDRMRSHIILKQRAKNGEKRIANCVFFSMEIEGLNDSAALAQSISRLSRMIRLPAVLSAFEYREKS